MHIWGTTTSHRCCLLSVFGFVTMFVLSVNEINEFKGCPLPEYFQNESRSKYLVRICYANWCLGVMFFLVFVPIIGMHLVHKYGWEHWEPFAKHEPHIETTGEHERSSGADDSGIIILLIGVAWVIKLYTKY